MPPNPPGPARARALASRFAGGRSRAALRPYVDRRFWLLLGTVGLLGLAIGLVEALILRIVGELAAAIDTVTGPDATFSLGPFADLDVGTLVALGIGATVVLIALRVTELTLVAKIGSIPLINARRRLAAAYLNADHHSQQAMSAGEFQELATAHSIRLGSMALATATFVSATLVTVSLATVAAIVNLPALGVLAAVMFGVLAIMTPVHRLAQRLGRRQVHANTELAKRTAEMARASTEARVFGVTETIEREHHDHVAEVGALHARSVSVNLFGSSLFQALVLGVVVVLGGVLAARQTGDFAAAGTVALIALRAQMAGRQALTANLSMANSAPYAEQLTARLERFRASSRADGQAAVGPIERVELRGVWFTHPPDFDDAPGDGGVHRDEPLEPVLRDLDLALDRGDHVGIVGPSGAGKTTLIEILLGLRRPDCGVYELNGRPRDDYSASTLSRAIASVPQRPVLVSATVTENIRFFRAIPDDEIVRAAKAAGIHDEIVRWVDGYDTVIGERGVRQVSGGQAQRIAFARALAGGPTLLVMDEPTSSIDNAGAKIITDTMERLDRDTAAIIVSHRLEALRSCDRIYRMVDGRLVEVID